MGDGHDRVDRIHVDAVREDGCVAHVEVFEAVHCEVAIDNADVGRAGLDVGTTLILATF